jgi:hypothetical protein
MKQIYGEILRRYAPQNDKGAGEERTEKFLLGQRDQTQI